MIALEEIEEGVFAKCRNLKEVHISKSVQNIRRKASGEYHYDVFEECPDLTVFCPKGGRAVELATEEDRRYEIDKWVTFFKAITWKELKDMAATNQYMEAAADTILEISSDENIRELCRRRAEFEAYERHNAEEHARKDALIEKQSKQLAEKDAALAEKDSALTESLNEIARLKALLEKNTEFR